jgi:hypothetical protein
LAKRQNLVDGRVAIETFDAPETGKPTQYGQLSHKQGLMQALKPEATTPDTLEI